MINEIPTEMLQDFNQEQKSVLENLTRMLSECPWDADSIGSCIVDASIPVSIAFLNNPSFRSNFPS